MVTITNDQRMQGSFTDWFKATQVMVSIALVISMVSLLVGLCSVCAPYNLHRIVSIATTCTGQYMISHTTVTNAELY